MLRHVLEQRAIAIGIARVEVQAKLAMSSVAIQLQLVMDRRLVDEHFDEGTTVARLELAQFGRQAHPDAVKNAAQEITHAEFTGPASKDGPQRTSSWDISQAGDNGSRVNDLELQLAQRQSPHG